MGTSKHHMLPKAQGGKGKGRDNISHVDAERHRLWHKLWSGDVSIHDIVAEMNDQWIPQEYILVLKKRRRR